MTIHAHTLRNLRRAWPTLARPRPSDLTGTFEASYVGAPLRAVAPRGLALVGLPRWYGKRFTADDRSPGVLTGVNLVRPRHGQGLQETLPMTATIGPSFADGDPALVVSYPADARRPWRWVRDEFRPWEDGVLLGLTFVDLPGVRRGPGTPFVLVRSTAG